MALSSKQTEILKELRNLPDAELRREITERRAELATARVKARQSSLEQPHRVRQLRRNIARMLTIANARSASS